MAAFHNDLLLSVPVLCERVRSGRFGKSSKSAARHFYDFDPLFGINLTRPTSHAVRRLTLLDQAYRPKTRSVDLTLQCEAAAYASSQSAEKRPSLQLPEITDGLSS